MNAILGAIIEAWEEVKINRVRFILSLIGVGAAVWAMSTVIALGNILNAAQQHRNSQYNGVRGTIIVNTFPSFESERTYDEQGQLVNESGEPFSPDENKFRAAALATVDRLKITHWTTRQAYNPTIDAPNYNECFDEMCSGSHPQLFGIDPDYFSIYGRVLASGRLLNMADEQLQMNPAVVNEQTWRAMGQPDLRTHPRLWVGIDHKRSVTVVGVIKDITPWDMPEIYTLAADLPHLMSEKDAIQAGQSNPEFHFVAPAGEEEQAANVAAAVLKANLGEGYDVQGTFNPAELSAADDQAKLVTTVISTIGGVVILLGALGLLTVSVVTVKTRVREIGMRRAVGASAKRIFFSVLMESVVATTAAGFFGVLVSIVTVRVAPFEKIDIDLGGIVWAYPMEAALIGVLISAGVGCLCGIIPATIAVKMRPIDAIRF